MLYDLLSFVNPRKRGRQVQERQHMSSAWSFSNMNEMVLEGGNEMKCREWLKMHFALAYYVSFISYI